MLSLVLALVLVLALALALFCCNSRSDFYFHTFLYICPCVSPFVGRASAGGSAVSGLYGKLAVGRSLGKLTPKQLGDEDKIDEDVQTEANRVAAGGADNDVVKVRWY